MIAYMQLTFYSHSVYVCVCAEVYNSLENLTVDKCNKPIQLITLDPSQSIIRITIIIVFAVYYIRFI
jgi:hypothetical protein